MPRAWQGMGGSTSLIPNLGYLWSSIQTRREGGSIATEFRLLECEWISNIGTYIHPHTLSGSGHVLQPFQGWIYTVDT